MSSHRNHDLNVVIDSDGVLRMSGTFHDGGVLASDIDAMVMPLVSIGARYACRINDGLTFHATPMMVNEQFVLVPERDMWTALAQESNRSKAHSEL